MRVSPVSGKPLHEEVKIQPTHVLRHGIEARTAAVSSSIKAEGLEGAFPGSREIERITLPEEEEPAEEAFAEEAGALAAAAFISNTNVSHPKTALSTAERVGLVFEHFTATLSRILSRAAIRMVESNTRERQRQSAETAKKRREEEKETIRRQIKEDQQSYDRKQDVIKVDQQRFESRPPTAR